jgi:alpha-L-fucosidase
MTDKNTSVNDAASAQHQLIGAIDADPARSFKRTTHPDAQWFENAGLGLFIHWGISGVHGGIDLSWGMMANTTWDAKYENRNKIIPREYFKLADHFKAENYDPDKWIETAAKAGFKYAVLTTKHHDGFALWPSKYSNFSTATHLGGRDLVKPFVEACRKYGLKVGLYYSPPDWYYNREYMSFNFGSDEYYKRENPELFKDRVYYDIDHKPGIQPEKPENWDNEFKAYIKNQVEELLTQYGKIDLIWFDGGPEAISIDRIRELQPSIVINPRMHGYGDYKTPEVNLPNGRPSGWWELCHMWNIGGWGYTRPERYMPTSWMLSMIARTRAWGGNILINCAPRPNGEMPDLYYERMAELAAWMQVNGDAVIGAEGGPYPEKCNMPVTSNQDKWYIHLIEDCQNKVVITETQKPSSITILRTEEKLPYHFEEGTLTIEVPHCDTNKLHEVVCIKWPESSC